MRRPKIKSSAAEIFSTPEDENPIKMLIGTSLLSNLYKEVYIDCPVEALPPAKVIWKFEGKPISTVKNVDVLDNGTLWIESILWEHEGSFECFQANPVGIDSVYSKIKIVGELRLQFRPIYLSIIPPIGHIIRRVTVIYVGTNIANM